MTWGNISRVGAACPGEGFAVPFRAILPRGEVRSLPGMRTYVVPGINRGTGQLPGMRRPIVQAAAVRRLRHDEAGVGSAIAGGCDVSPCPSDPCGAGGRVPCHA